MVKRTDMAYTDAEIRSKNKSYGVESADDATTPTYSWGLKIRLEQLELDKLGIDELPRVGDRLYLDICAKVTSVQKMEDENDTRSSVELQITMIGIDSNDDEEELDEMPAKTARSIMSSHSY